MSGSSAPADGPPAGGGSRAGPGGTPFPVDVSRDRRNRVVTVVLLAGPVVWSAHFLLVYAIVEAGCTGDGPGLRLFDPPVPTIATLVATAVAAAACAGCAWWGYRRWRGGERSEEAEDQDPGGAVAFAGFLLSLLSLVSVLFTGLPALYLPAC